MQNEELLPHFKCPASSNDKVEASYQSRRKDVPLSPLNCPFLSLCSFSGQVVKNGFWVRFLGSPSRSTCFGSNYALLEIYTFQEQSLILMQYGARNRVRSTCLWLIGRKKSKPAHISMPLNYFLSPPLKQSFRWFIYCIRIFAFLTG